MILTDFNLSAAEPNSAVALILESLDIKYFRKSLWLEREKNQKKNPKQREPGLRTLTHPCWMYIKLINTINMHRETKTWTRLCNVF